MVGRSSFPRFRNRSSSNAPSPTLSPATAAAAASALSATLQSQTQAPSQPQVQAGPATIPSGIPPPAPKLITSAPAPGAAASNNSAAATSNPSAGTGSSRTIMPKVMHSAKMALKATGAKKLVKEDETLAKTEETLNKWLTAVKQLLTGLQSNEQAWQGLFGTYAQFGPIMASIYPHHDNEALHCASELTNYKVALDNLPEGVESNFDAVQRVDIAKKDLTNLEARIFNAKKMHAERVAIIREWRYYDEKTKQMIASEQKKKAPATPKEYERRSRNEAKCVELAAKLNSTNNQLYYEMDAIAVEHLAAADRAFSAFLQLQMHYFKAFPASRAYEAGARVGLGRRVLIRDQSKPWLPASSRVQLANSGTSTDGGMPDSPAQTTALSETPVISVPPFNPNAATTSNAMQHPPITSGAMNATPIVPQGMGQPQQVPQTLQQSLSQPQSLQHYYASPHPSGSVPETFTSQPQHVQQSMYYQQLQPMTGGIQPSGIQQSMGGGFQQPMGHMGTGMQHPSPTGVGAVPMSGPVAPPQQQSSPMQTVGVLQAQGEPQAQGQPMVPPLLSPPSIMPMALNSSAQMQPVVQTASLTTQGNDEKQALAQ